MFPKDESISNAAPPLAKENEVILESLSEGVCRITSEGKIVFANASAARMLGREKMELLGRDYSEVFFAKEEKAFVEEKTFCPIYFTIESGETSHVNRDIFYTKDKRELHVEYMCMALADSAGSGGVVISFEDVAERNEAEVALSEARDAALEAANLKASFLANMSHEIRTPLNGIIGTTDLLLETGLSENQKRYAKMLKTSTDLLRHIVNDILDFSKVEAGRFNLEGVDFEISDLVEETLGLFEAVAMKKGLKIEAKIEKSVPKIVSADINKIRQILNNLLNNGIKFTSKGRVSLQVSSIASEKDSEMLKFAVSDTGIGIQKEIQSNLFQPFQQADSSTTRLFGGTGLGLAICKKFVELMNGEIGVESEIDKGSTFWFTIEAKIPTHEKAKEELVDSNPVSLTEVKNSDLKVLVVEDNFINREITTKMLEQIGLRAKCVENGLESLNSVSDEAFDLVLMDCQMPVMDGFEATKKIRANSKLEKQPKIIALTASSAIEDSIKCLEVGMDDYLPKPFTKNDLAGLVASHFGLESPSKNLDFEGDFIQHSLSDIIKPATLENFREIESNGDNQFTKEILVLFSKHTEEQLDEIWVLFSGNDFDGIKRRAHNLKGSSANVGIERLHKRFENMEQQAEQGDVKAIEEQIRLAFIEFKETKNIILGL